MVRWICTEYVCSTIFKHACRPTSMQPEFRPILFPIFCHFYLDLIQHGFKDAGTYKCWMLRQTCNLQMFSAQRFFQTFSASLSPSHSSVLHHLSTLLLPAHAQNDELAQRFRNEKYTIKMSRSGFGLLVGWLTEGYGGEALGSGDGFTGEKGKRGRTAVMRVVNNHLRFDGAPSPFHSKLPLTHCLSHFH